MLKAFDNKKQFSLEKAELLLIFFTHLLGMNHKSMLTIDPAKSELLWNVSIVLHNGTIGHIGYFLNP
jgi:hypothetical protein